MTLTHTHFKYQIISMNCYDRIIAAVLEPLIAHTYIYYPSIHDIFLGKSCFFSPCECSITFHCWSMHLKFVFVPCNNWLKICFTRNFSIVGWIYMYIYILWATFCLCFCDTYFIQSQFDKKTPLGPQNAGPNLRQILPLFLPLCLEESRFCHLAAKTK